MAACDSQFLLLRTVRLSCYQVDDLLCRSPKAVCVNKCSAVQGICPLFVCRYGVVRLYPVDWLFSTQILFASFPASLTVDFIESSRFPFSSSNVSSLLMVTLVSSPPLFVGGLAFFSKVHSIERYAFAI